MADYDQGPVLPPPPRRARLTKRGVLLRGVYLGIFIVMGALILIGWNVDYRNDALLRNTGVVVTAEVVEKYKSDNDYDVVYAYTVNGREYQQTEPVSASRYHSTPLHSDVEITYAFADPQDSGLGRYTDATLKRQQDSILGFIILFVPFAWIVFSLCDSAVRRQVRLVRRGVVGTGIVTDTWTRRDGMMDVDVRYEVNGHPYKSRSLVAQSSQVVPDQQVTILYLPNKPKVSIMVDGIWFARP